MNHNISTGRFIRTLATLSIFAISLTLVNSAKAADVVVLSPGWNIVSTPRVLENHVFSASEISANFDIYILNASSTSGWSTMAEVGQTEFLPLYGYFVNNKTGRDQTLTFNYKQNVDTAARSFERTFTRAGWYSIGPANPTYMKPKNGDTVDTNNVSGILSSLSGNHSDVIDFTSADHLIDPASVRVGGAWSTASAANMNTLNDLRETKGYAIFVTTTGAVYKGFQNQEQITPAVGVHMTTASGTDQVVAPGSTNVPLAVIELSPVAAGSTDDVRVTRIIVADITTSDYSEVTNLAMFDSNGDYLGTISNTAINSASTVFQFGTPIVVSSTASTTVTLRGDVVSGVNSDHKFVAAAVTAYSVADNSPAASTVLGEGRVVAIRGAGSVSLYGVTGERAAPLTDQNVTVGAVNVPVFAVRLEAVNEPFALTSFKLSVTSTIRSANDLSNIRLYRNDDTEPFASVSQMTLADGKLSHTWSAASNLLPSAVAPGSPVTIYVKADIGSAGAAVLNDSFRFGIESSSDVVAKGTSSNLTLSVSGAPTVQATSYITPFTVVVSGDAPTANVTEAVITGTQLARVRIYNNGSSRVTVSGIKFSDNGVHTGDTTTFSLLYSDLNASNYTGNVAVNSSPSVDFSTYGGLFTLEAGAYRYVTVVIADIGSSTSGDTYQLSLPELGDVTYWVVESDLGYDATGEGILINIVNGLKAEGKPLLGTITKT